MRPSLEWLALREPADLRARDGMLAMDLAARLQAKPSVRVVDLGCGIGANLRATYAALGREQYWSLCDESDDALATARPALRAWADAIVDDGDMLVLRKSAKTLVIDFRLLELNDDLDAALDPHCDLVTASALFDRCSKTSIETCANVVAQRRAIFYATLTRNGAQLLTPRHPDDAEIFAAYHQQVSRTAPSQAGSDAPHVLADAFKAMGYSVKEGDSTWYLARSDQPLVTALLDELKSTLRSQVSPGTALATWLTHSRHGAQLGHTDLLAWPAE